MPTTLDSDEPRFGEVWSWSASPPMMVIALGEPGNPQYIECIKLLGDEPIRLMWKGSIPGDDGIRMGWQRLDTEELV